MTDEKPNDSPGGIPVGRLASKGAAWMFGLNLSNRALGLVRTAVVARLLGPDDLGLFGIAMLCESVFAVFTMFGLTSALTRQRNDASPYYDTAWMLDTVRGFAVAGLMVLVAPLVARFFGRPDAVNLIRVLAITSALAGLGNPAVTALRRTLRFGRVYWLVLIPGLVDVAASTVIVIFYRSPMALILGLVARAGVALALGYIFVPYRPRLRFERRKARELLSYGKWITGSTVLRFLHGEGDDILVGRVLGATSLGFYQIAYKYSNLPTTEVTRVLQQVALPAYAAVQDNPARLRRAFSEALEVTSLVSIGFAGFVWAITPDFVQLVLGSQWVDAIPIMRVLAIWGAVEAASEIPIAMFEAIGRPGLATRRLLVKTLLLAALIWPMMSRWHVLGVSYAVLMSAVPALIWSLWDAGRIAKVPAREVVTALGVPILAAVVTGAGAVGLAHVLRQGTAVSLVAVCAMSCAALGVVWTLAAVAGYKGPRRLWARARQVIAR